MALVYNQALSHRFGVSLIEFLESSDWTSFETAVAWVRRSGVRHLKPALKSFLTRGGVVKFVVGIDIENTSKEGLQDLLSLEVAGQCQTHIYHNEYSVIFHPKLYLFSNNKRSRLIIGSNNLTEAGLFTNTEMSLQIDAKVKDDVILDVRKALLSWRDESENLARKLTSELLEQLEQEGYVFSEQVLRTRRLASESKRRETLSRNPRQKLFGAKTFSPPAPPLWETRENTEGIGDTTGGIRLGGRLNMRGYRSTFPITNVLLMRARRARLTQVQLSKPLRDCEFFAGRDSIVSGHDHVPRVISATKPKRSKGVVNTYKVEMPETAGISNPLVRFDRTGNDIVYHVYSPESTIGKLIYDTLVSGQQDNPPTTILTKPSEPERSTWFKFI